MKKPLVCAVVLVGVYLAAWTTSYGAMFLSRGDGLDFRYFFEYLVLAWTFRGGELVTFIWIGSLVVYLPSVSVIFLLRKKASTIRRRRSGV